MLPKAYASAPHLIIFGVGLVIGGTYGAISCRETVRLTDECHTAVGQISTIKQHLEVYNKSPYPTPVPDREFYTKQYEKLNSARNSHFKKYCPSWEKLNACMDKYDKNLKAAGISLKGESKKSSSGGGISTK